jgi:hypothetical protein
MELRVGYNSKTLKEMLMQKITPAQLWYAVQVYSCSTSPERAQKIYDQNVSELNKKYWSIILKKIYLLCNPMYNRKQKKINGVSCRKSREKSFAEIEYD